jgi:hypothetical protein
MDARALGAVAFKVWGIILFLTSSVAVPTVIMGMTATPYPTEQAALVRASLMSSLLGLLASATLGLFLVLCGDWLARRALPPSEPIQTSIDSSQLLRISLAVVGVVTLIGGLADVASLGYVLSGKPEWGEVGTTEYLWNRDREAVVRAAVYVVAGVLLILGRHGLASTWEKLAPSRPKGAG